MALFKRSKSDETPNPEPPPEPMSGPSPIGARPDPARTPESGLALPPRPNQAKDTAAMSRPPFPAGPAPQQAAPPRAGAIQGRQPAERRTLVVGRGITVHGTIQDAERLVVEGTVEATMIQAAELSVAQGGVFRGEAQVEDAEIAGIIDGTLTARGTLVIRGSGRVLGTARCRRLQVEEGGQISGQMEMLAEPPAPEPAN